MPSTWPSRRGDSFPVTCRVDPLVSRQSAHSLAQFLQAVGSGGRREPSQKGSKLLAETFPMFEEREVPHGAKASATEETRTLVAGVQRRRGCSSS